MLKVSGLQLLLLKFSQINVFIALILVAIEVFVCTCLVHIIVVIEIRTTACKVIDGYVLINDVATIPVGIVLHITLVLITISCSQTVVSHAEMTTLCNSHVLVSLRLIIMHFQLALGLLNQC